jgi:hypothetical protein
MRVGRPIAFLFVWGAGFMLGTAGLVVAAMAAKPSVLVAFADPQTADDTNVLAVIKQHGWLDPVLARLKAFKLKRPVTFKMRTCSGRDTAWYEDDTVTVCYRYVGDIIRHAARADRPPWVSEEEAIAGGVVDVFFHEFGHAFFEQHNVPVLGREEDAADQFAAYLMLTPGRQEAASLIKGIAYIYLRWLRDYGGRGQRQRTLTSGARIYAADPHGSAAQRFFNVVCFAMGTGEEAFKELARQADLPEDRAEGCGEEYGLFNKAWQRLIAPHIDETAARAARGTSLIAPFRKTGG